MASAGLAVGSFIALTSVRLPLDEPIVAGRSRCRSCGQPLGIRELVPILSWLMQHGRCRACDATVSARYPLTELAAGAIGVAAALVALDPAHAIAGALLGWTLLLLAILDLEHLWLPQPLTLGLAAAGLGATALLARDRLADHAIGAAAGFGSLWLIAAAYRRLRAVEGLGGGDARLFAAAGAWLGWAALPWVLLGAALLGLAAALVLWLTGRLGAGTQLPFGAALAAAIWTGWLAAT